MLKINKLADYGTLVLAQMARTDQAVWQAADLAEKTGISEPMARKILKILAKSSFLDSKRGVSGGYSLAKPAKAINLADIIHVLDPGAGLTVCSSGSKDCMIHQRCHVKSHWLLVNQLLTQMLQMVTLADLANSQPVNQMWEKINVGLNKSFKQKISIESQLL